MVEGFYNQAHVIRLFIANEYAFAYFFDDREIRVAHKKGTWTFAKLSNDKKIKDWFSWGDNFSGVYSENELTSNVAGFIRTHERSKGLHTREEEASAICRVLEIWAGKPSEITKISVIQPGRNSEINPSTYEFECIPSIQEFKQ